VTNRDDRKVVGVDSVRLATAIILILKRSAFIDQATPGHMRFQSCSDYLHGRQSILNILKISTAASRRGQRSIQAEIDRNRVAGVMADVYQLPCPSTVVEPPDE
jgi:hypothetical protein